MALPSKPKALSVKHRTAAMYLEHYVINDKALLAKLRAVDKALNRKKGPFSEVTGYREFMPLVDFAAKQYAHQGAFGGAWDRAFPKPVREYVARVFARNYVIYWMKR